MTRYVDRPQQASPGSSNSRPDRVATQRKTSTGTPFDHAFSGRRGAIHNERPVVCGVAKISNDRIYFKDFRHDTKIPPGHLKRLKAVGVPQSTFAILPDVDDIVRLVCKRGTWEVAPLARQKWGAKIAYGALGQKTQPGVPLLDVIDALDGEHEQQPQRNNVTAAALSQEPDMTDTSSMVARSGSDYVKNLSVKTLSVDRVKALLGGLPKWLNERIAGAAIEVVYDIPTDGCNWERLADLLIENSPPADELPLSLYCDDEHGVDISGMTVIAVFPSGALRTVGKLVRHAATGRVQVDAFNHWALLDPDGASDGEAVPSVIRQSVQLLAIEAA